MKKIISIALALLMVAVMLPVMAMAEGANVVSTPDALTAAVTKGGEYYCKHHYSCRHKCYP